MSLAVIFDLDGLLIDSEPLWSTAHIQVLNRLGYVITEDDTRHMAGKGTSAQIRIWQERFGWDDSFNTPLRAKIEDEVEKLIKLELQMKSGALSLLQLLHSHNIPVAIASASTKEFIDLVIRTKNIEPYVHVVCSAKDEQHGKPSPDVYLSAARLLGVSTTDCVVFEDSPTGAKSAKNAQMYCVGVPDQNSKASLENIADIVISSLDEVTLDFLRERIQR